MDNLGFTYHLFESSDKQKTYEKGAYIFYKGEVALGIYRVLKGRVKLWKSSEKAHRNILFYFVNSSEYFGILENFDNSGVRRCSAIAVDKKVIVQFVPFYELQKRIISNPITSLAIIQYLIKKREINWENYCDLLVNNINQRLFRALLKMANENGVHTNKGIILKAISHQELADYIGATRQSIAASMNKFRRENKVEYSRKQILIKKIE